MADLDLSYTPCLLDDDIFTFETCDRSEVQILDTTQESDITGGVSESEFQNSLNALFKTIVEEHCDDESDNTSVSTDLDRTPPLTSLLAIPPPEKSNADQVRELSTLFRFHASSIEMRRMDVMADTSLTSHYRDWLSHHFDRQIHQVIDRVEKSLSLLEEKEKKSVENQTNFLVPGVKRRPPLSKRAVQLMEGWYQSNLHHPYPSAIVCESLAVAGNVTVDQVKKWFGNKRNRSSNTRTRSEIAKRKFRNRHGIQEYDILRALECGY
ncbi:homeobox protein ceh-20-like [Haliotis rubra]|uniref:homeobox protein ceh-20-like n=1 Tax=Haliotis rubra TaxID=36100 RepID=UPI001EE58D81|nr:homeobox protein ceh-20-like [Haliotis rubra]